MAAERARRSRLSDPARLQLLTKVARLYHEQGLGQPEIAARLSLSQSRVSRLLKEAVEIGVVRTIVVPPPGVFGELEDAVRDAYGMLDVVVVDAPSGDPEALVRSIGRAGAVYLETSLLPADRVGVSSWSATLLAAVDAVAPRPVREVDEIVQVIGGVGRPEVQVRATHLVEQLARATGATPTFFTVPGIVASPGARNALMEDPYVRSVHDLWASLTVMLVGIGSLQPSDLLKDSGNAVSPEDQAALRSVKAVGDICLRFFDAEGELVETPLHDRVLGISPERILATPRRVAFAGGAHKHAAIRGALRGGWVNVLVTDRATAQYLATG
jgi:DNA-binding transcriptional regulator LsrR (DeoR family)